MTDASDARSKRAKRLAAVGALAIAAALGKMATGEKPDCSPYAKCRRLVEAARAEWLCAKQAANPVKNLECVVDVNKGYDDVAKECPALDFKRECAPFVKDLPIDPNVPLLPQAKQR